jgi:hypothetical protein
VSVTSSPPGSSGSSTTWTAGPDCPPALTAPRRLGPIGRLHHVVQRVGDRTDLGALFHYERVVGERDERTVALDPVGLDGHDRVPLAARGTPWTPVSIHPGGCGSVAGSAVSPLAGKLLVERLPPPEEPHYLGSIRP